jgi:1,4-dihydroxy-6-naphthoate synthase
MALAGTIRGTSRKDQTSVSTLSEQQSQRPEEQKAAPKTAEQKIDHKPDHAASASREIKIAHSPDSDDAFMFYGLATNKVRVPGYRFTHTLTDIETLNQKAMHEAFYDVTAISFHAYPYLQENYALMSCGGSVGEGYGPMIVASRRISLDEVRKLRIAVPGTLTTAYLALKLFAPEIETTTVPFDRIIPEILAGRFDAGLIIHEGQLTYGTSGLHKVIDLGQWWRQETKLPLPLGGNAIRRSLGSDVMLTVTKALRESIQHALDHREEALAYAMQFARDLDAQLANRFVSMYVNERTLNYGEDGKQAIRKLLELGHERGIIPHPVKVDFVG